jgi:hypothetical protein
MEQPPLQWRLLRWFFDADERARSSDGPDLAGIVARASVDLGESPANIAETVAFLATNQLIDTTPVAKTSLFATTLTGRGLDYLAFSPNPPSTAQLQQARERLPDSLPVLAMLDPIVTFVLDGALVGIALCVSLKTTDDAALIGITVGMALVGLAGGIVVSRLAATQLIFATRMGHLAGTLLLLWNTASRFAFGHDRTWGLALSGAVALTIGALFRLRGIFASSRRSARAESR